MLMPSSERSCDVLKGHVISACHTCIIPDHMIYTYKRISWYSLRQILTYEGFTFFNYGAVANLTDIYFIIIHWDNFSYQYCNYLSADWSNTMLFKFFT